MGIISWIILGLVAGWLASIAAGTNRSQGMIGDMLVGILGAFVGGFLANMLGGTGITGFNLYSILLATLGAFLLLWAKGKLRSA